MCGAAHAWSALPEHQSRSSTLPRPKPRPQSGSAPPSPARTSPAAVGQSKMEGAPLAPLALRLLLLATLPAPGWLQTGIPEPPPPGAPKVGQGGRSVAAPPPGPSGEARAGGPRRPPRCIPPQAAWPWTAVRAPKGGIGEKRPRKWGGWGGGSGRANGALGCVVKPRDAKLRDLTQSELLPSRWGFARKCTRSRVTPALVMAAP